MREQYQSFEFIFVVTYGRSGSTLLQAVLQSIDGYFIRGENANALWHLYKRYCSAYEARYTHGMRPISATGPWYGADDIDPDAYASSLADVFLEKVVQPPADARVVGFKEIRFHEGGFDQIEAFLLFIAKVFPSARFIFNTRNWEDVAKSGWWVHMAPEKVKATIQSCDAAYSAFAAKYPDISFLMQYEDVKASPANFKPLFDFLGEAFDLEKMQEITSNQFSQFKF